jgi:hypothetical protein
MGRLVKAPPSREAFPRPLPKEEPLTPRSRGGLEFERSLAQSVDSRSPFR